jgi:hypothetical protein
MNVLLTGLLMTAIAIGRGESCTMMRPGSVRGLSSKRESCKAEGIPRARTSQPAFLVQESKMVTGQKGLIATRGIKPGEVILEERAMLSMYTGGKDIYEADHAVVRSIVEGFLSLPQETRAEVLQLTDPPFCPLTEADMLQAIISEKRQPWNDEEILRWLHQQCGCNIPPGRTADIAKFIRVWNGNSVSGRSPEKHLYHLYCRINHSCSPNAGAQSGKNENTVRVIALEDIQAGDEITVCYEREQAMLLPRHARQAALDKWFDSCSCSRCQSEFEDTRIFPCPKNCIHGVCLGYYDVPRGVSACHACGAQYSDTSQKRLKVVEDNMEKKFALIIMAHDMSKREGFATEEAKSMLPLLDNKVYVDPEELEKWPMKLHFAAGNIARMLLDHFDIAANDVKTVKTGLRFLEVYQGLVERMFPRLSVVYVENMQIKARMLTRLERYEEAMNAYAYALAQLKLWGSFSGFVVETLVRELLVCTEKFDAKSKLRSAAYAVGKVRVSV